MSPSTANNANSNIAADVNVDSASTSTSTAIDTTINDVHPDTANVNHPARTNSNRNLLPLPTALTAMKEPVIDNLTPSQYESYLLHTLTEANRMAKNTETLSREIAMAKMLRNCIRMLHSHSWVPATVVRAMVHMEIGVDTTVKGLLYRSMREKREENRARRVAKHEAGNRLGAGKEDAGGDGVDFDGVAGDCAGSVGEECEEGTGAEKTNGAACEEKTGDATVVEKK